MVLQDSDTEDGATKGVAVGILFVIEDGVPTSSAMVQDITGILEEAIVLDDVPDLPTAPAYLF